MSNDYVFVVNDATCSRCGLPSGECACDRTGWVENWLEEALERRDDLLLPPEEPLVPVANVDGELADKDYPLPLPDTLRQVLAAREDR